jgi:hypothetical protein
VPGARETAVDVQEIRKLEAFLRGKFDNARIRVVACPDGSAEVCIGEAKIADLSVDDEDGERCYQLAVKIPGSKLE